MDFDWKSIAGVVAPLAPKLGAVLGTAIGGPFGSVIGGLAGSAIAATFGTEATPDAVGKAIAEDPKAADKLARLEEERGQEILAQAQAEIARAEQQGLTQRANVTEINQTIRAEAGTVSWYHWRNLIGYLVILYGIQQILMLWIAALYPKVLSPADASNLFNATTIFTGGLFAVLGYVASDTTDRYKTAITGERGPGGLISSTLDAIKKGRK